MSAPETTDTERQQWLMDALEEAQYRWTLYANATDPVTQANYLVTFANAMSDLSTYHPTYDYESGTLGWQRVDDDA